MGDALLMQKTHDVGLEGIEARSWRLCIAVFILCPAVSRIAMHTTLEPCVQLLLGSVSCDKYDSLQMIRASIAGEMG
jgi:hypothetical protein